MRAFATGLLLALAGCGGSLPDHLHDGINPAPGTTLSFQAAGIHMTRFPSTCGVMNPPFLDADLYSLDLVGAKPLSGTPTAISLTMHRTVPIRQDLSAGLQPFGNGTQSGTADGNDVVFAWSQGNNPDEIDSKPLTGVTLRFDAFPQKDGDPLQLRIEMQFQDGGVLDFFVQAALTSSFGGCGQA